MSRLLSQAEVDALLESFESDADLPELQSEILYDLRAPLLLAGDRLALVQAACEKLASVIGHIVTILMIAERPVRASFIGISQQPASTILGTLTPGEPLALLTDDHEEPVGGITLQPELALAMVDRIQGGEGAAPDGVRALSAVERRLLSEALGRMARHLDQHTGLGPIHGGGLDVDPVFGRLASRGGTLAAAQFRLTTALGDASCRLLLTPVLTNRLIVDEPGADRGDIPEELFEAMAGVPIRVEPVITGATLSLGDLKRMSAGSVLQLDIREHEGLALRFNGELLARGELKVAGHDRIFEVSELTAERLSVEEKAS